MATLEDITERFRGEGVDVLVGHTAKRIEVVDGLKPGAVVATKGAFLLKAELGKGEAEH